ncbi:MAG: hypothetical protein HG465_000385 [Mogibacterium sp.]|uniref:hypothetical protein n=1 Tax=Mogibacterium sp. TaxID=2049035 RepID=UPI001857EA32|nr:hypothetical protein [Mogibacterium sp.]MBB1532589.1 hypothetical protein [Mogibacterium sp.]
MLFKCTTDYIYETSAKRVKKAIKESNLKLNDIYDGGSTILSMIQNNKRDKAHNRFLITDTARDCLVEKLPFDDEIHLLWGNKEERQSQILPLFIFMVRDSDYNSEIDHTLYAYTGYAYDRTYFNFINKGIYPAYKYGIREDDIMNSIGINRYLASIFIFSECKEQIESAVLEFMQRTKSFKNLPKKIDFFLRNKLTEILINYEITSNAVGYRAESIIMGDLKYREDIEKPESVTEQLISASEKYMDSIENIQIDQMKTIYKKMFPDVYEIINNKTKR